MKLVLLHGWGFDASLWQEMKAALPEFDVVAWDRGYFRAPRRTVPDGRWLGIGHSLGSLLLALERPAGCAGLVAINGFDRFTAPDRVPQRVVERMQAQFARTPATVLRDFRARCGAPETPADIDAARLGDDLCTLAEADARGGPALLALDGSDDPIVPPAMRAAVFPDARRATCPGGGHLLPATHPQWCADRIREVAAWA